MNVFKFKSKTIVKRTYEEVIQHISDNKNAETTAAAVIDSNIARFMNMDLILPTEREARISLG